MTFFSFVIKTAIHSSLKESEIRLTANDEQSSRFFVLLFISMLMNIMYYGVQTDGPDAVGITIGPIKLTVESVTIFIYFKLFFFYFAF